MLTINFKIDSRMVFWANLDKDRSTHFHINYTSHFNLRHYQRHFGEYRAITWYGRGSIYSQVPKPREIAARTISVLWGDYYWHRYLCKFSLVNFVGGRSNVSRHRTYSSKLAI